MTENPAAQLADGSTPATPADVEKLLDQLGVSYETVEHPPMFTVADSRKHREGVP